MNIFYIIISTILIFSVKINGAGDEEIFGGLGEFDTKRPHSLGNIYLYETDQESTPNLSAHWKNFDSQHYMGPNQNNLEETDNTIIPQLKTYREANRGNIKMIETPSFQPRKFGKNKKVIHEQNNSGIYPVQSGKMKSSKKVKLEENLVPSWNSKGHRTKSIGNRCSLNKESDDIPENY